MKTTKSFAMAAAAAMASLFASAALALGAGAVSAGSASASGGSAGAASPGAHGGGAVSAGPSAGGGGVGAQQAPAAAPHPTVEHLSGTPSGAAPPQNAPADTANRHHEEHENHENRDGHRNHNGDRPAWRRRNESGGYNYANPNFYPAFPYGGYINAGADGYYNGYYGYSDVDNGPPVVEPGTGGNAPAQQAAPAPAAPAAANPSPVSAAALQQNSADNNPQVIAADAAVRQAQEAFDVERRRVLDALQQKPEYQQALARRGAAQEKLSAARAGDAVPDPSRLAPAASAKMEAGDEVTRMQQQAIDVDPAAKAAQVRLHEAVLRRDQLRAAAMGKYQP